MNAKIGRGILPASSLQAPVTSKVVVIKTDKNSLVLSVERHAISPLKSTIHPQIPRILFIPLVTEVEREERFDRWYCLVFLLFSSQVKKRVKKPTTNDEMQPLFSLYGLYEKNLLFLP
jgi:hypothetical protein